MAVGAGIGSLRCFSVPDFAPLWTVTAERFAGRGISFSPDGRFLASSSVESWFKLTSTETGVTVRRFEGGHASHVAATVFSGDGRKVFSGSQDGTVRAWWVFPAAERRVKGLLGGLEVLEGDWEMKEVCCEVVRRMMRLWEVEVV